MLSKYYQKHKETLRKEARGKYQNLPEEKTVECKKRFEKDIKVFLKKKNKLLEHMKKSYSAHKK